MINAVSTSMPVNVPKDDREQKLYELSQDLEATFLAEMLKSAGFGKSRENFGGGVGEDQFSSFLVQNQARSLVDRGGVGLAEQLFNSLKAR